MAKASSNEADIGLISATTLTADGATTAVQMPPKRLVNLAVSVPVGVTATVQVSYDAGATWYTATPSSLAVIDATSAAQAPTMPLYEEEPWVQYRVAASGTWAGGTMYVRFSGAALA
jgi:hypothetical protein